jgi:metallo-beta-lactamase family protein
MKVTLFGASGEVTGSAYYLQTGKSNILVDFGIFQGGKSAEARNRKFPPIKTHTLDAVVITHAHLDHTGRLPLLIKKGYRNPIYATPATIEMTRLILMDSVKVQEMETKRLNRKRLRSGQSAIEPDFEQEDVEKTIELMIPLPYDKPFEIAEAISLRAREAGHTLGSVSFELTITQNGTRKVILFSGDLGPQGLAIMKDPYPFSYADVVFMESTYGNRDHKSLEQTLSEGREIVKLAIQRKSKILVPSFAIGRSQQLLFYIARAVEEGNIPALDVYLDSPMAIEASRLYLKHKELFDDEMLDLYKTGTVKGDLSGIHVTETADESRAINNIPGPCMIIAGAGMCNAGRILHHLRHNLWNPDAIVMMVGYQAEGTLGRKLVDGFKKVRIFGEEIAVNASIATMWIFQSS